MLLRSLTNVNNERLAGANKVADPNAWSDLETFYSQNFFSRKPYILKNLKRKSRYTSEETVRHDHLRGAR